MTRLHSWKNGCVVFLFRVVAPIASHAQTFTTLFTFNYTDGSNPASLVQGTDGNLYGVTYNGGQYGAGELFEMTPEGKLKILYSFCQQGYVCLDGGNPDNLMQAANGNFYGTTLLGGIDNSGTAFQITPGGKFTTLQDFCFDDSCNPGFEPWGFVQGINGNLYGTTSGGGVDENGIVFEMTQAGKLTTIYNFCSESGCPVGPPPGGLILAPNGNLYGVTSYTRGCNGCGAVFVLTPNGTLPRCTLSSIPDPQTGWC